MADIKILVNGIQLDIPIEVRRTSDVNVGNKYSLTAEWTDRDLESIIEKRASILKHTYGSTDNAKQLHSGH